MPALLANTVAYAAQVLRNQKINPTGQGEGPSMILSARGTFYLVKLSDTYGPGIYSIDELTRQVLAPDSSSKNWGDVGATTNKNWNQNSPILLTSIEFNQVDITSQVPCLNNVKVFYSFGQNFGQVVIQGEVLLGPLGDLSYTGVERLVSFFWTNRVSVKHQPIAVSVANNAYFVYLTGLRIGQVNPDFHIMPFVMFGTLLDITRENAAAVNVRGQVFTGGKVNEPSLFEALQRTPSTSDSVSKSPGETELKISADNDPSLGELNEGSRLGPPAGVTGNPVSSAVDSTLKNEAVTQEEKELKLMQDEKVKARVKLAQLKRDAGPNPDSATQTAIAFAEADVDQLETAVYVQKNRVAQAKNLQAVAENPDNPIKAKVSSETPDEVYYWEQTRQKIHSSPPVPAAPESNSRRPTLGRYD